MLVIANFPDHTSHPNRLSRYLPPSHPSIQSSRFGYTGDDGEMVCFGTRSGSKAQGMWSREQVDHVSVPPLSSDATMATPACASMRFQLQVGIRYRLSGPLAFHFFHSTSSQDRATLDWNGCANNLGLKAKHGK